MIQLARLAADVIARRRGSGAPGQTLVEYGRLLSLLGIVVVIALIFLGPVASNLYSNVGENLQ